MVQVFHHGIKVHLQYRLMNLLFQLFSDIIKTKGARSLNKNHLVPQSLKHLRPQKLINIPKKEEPNIPPRPRISHRSRQFCCLAASHRPLSHRSRQFCCLAASRRQPSRQPSRYLLSYPDELSHTAVHSQLHHSLIQALSRFSALIDITKYQRTSFAFLFRPSAHKIKRYIQRIDIRVIRVIDKSTAMPSLLHFQSHRHRLQLRHPYVQFFCRNPKIQCHHSRCDGTFQRGIVDKRQMIPPLLSFIYII